MSSSAVREKFREQVLAWAAAQVPPVVFVETINTDDEPQAGERWVTISYSLEGVEDLTFGGSYSQESGTVSVSVFAAPGKGDAEVSALADSIVAHFRAIEAPLGSGVEVGVVGGPDDFAAPGQVTGGWFGLNVDVDYEAFLTT